MAERDAITLRNRLLLATGMWREATGEPLPKMEPGDPAHQIQSFEIRLVDRLWEIATPETARDVADRGRRGAFSSPGRSPTGRPIAQPSSPLLNEAGHGPNGVLLRMMN